MPWSRSQLETQCWTPTSQWRMGGPLQSSGWRFCGEHSWRSCLLWKAQGRAAERWWSAGLWSVGGSLWRWPWECDAAGLWRLAVYAWAPGCALAWIARAPYAYKLKKRQREKNISLQIRPEYLNVFPLLLEMYLYYLIGSTLCNFENINSVW